MMTLEQALNMIFTRVEVTPKDFVKKKEDKVIIGDTEGCEMKALVYLYNHRRYGGIWHQEIALKKDHDVRHLYCIEDKHVSLVKRVIKGLIRKFRNQQKGSDPELAKIYERIVKELKTIFDEVLKMLEDFVSYVELEKKMNRYGKFDNDHEGGSGSSVRAQDGYFDPETLLKLARISQETIGSISIIPGQISKENDNNIIPYLWQNKVRNTLGEIYPKIQSYCYKVTLTNNVSRVNPFSSSLTGYTPSKISQQKSKNKLSKMLMGENLSQNSNTKEKEISKIIKIDTIPLEDSITSKKLRQNRRESLDTQNSLKYLDKNMKIMNAGKTCDHEDCLIKAFCYISELDCYFGIRHGVSPGKDNFQKLYLYHIFSNEDFDIIKKFLAKVKEYVDLFDDFIKNININTSNVALVEQNQIFGFKTLAILKFIKWKIREFEDNMIHVSRDLEFQQTIFSKLNSNDLNSNRNYELSRDKTHSSLDKYNFLKDKTLKQYLDPKTLFELISISQAHFEELCQEEEISLFVKNIFRACILEVFYLAQGYHENIDVNLDSNFFILFFNALQDCKLHKDISEYIPEYKNLLITNLEQTEHQYDIKLIIAKFIEYQDQEELKHILKQPQKIYDETSLDFHIPNILSTYKKFGQINYQDDSKLYDQISKIKAEDTFYNDLIDRNYSKFILKILNKTFKGDHSSTGEDPPFYLLPECDKTLGFSHKHYEKYNQYSKFEPLGKCELLTMAELAKSMQRYYFTFYTGKLSNITDNTRYESYLEIKEVGYALSFMLSEILCKGFNNDSNNQLRNGSLSTFIDIDKILRGLLNNKEILTVGKLIMAKGIKNDEDFFEFQDRVLKLQVYQEFQAYYLNINKRANDKEVDYKEWSEVVNYLNNNHIYDENTDKLRDLDQSYVKDDSWGLINFKTNQQNNSSSLRRRNSMEICQGQHSKLPIEIKEHSLESEDETIQTDSERNFKTYIPACKIISEFKEDSGSKAEGEIGIKKQKFRKENFIKNNTEESKESSEIEISEQSLTSKTNSENFKILKSSQLSNKGIRLPNKDAEPKLENDLKNSELYNVDTNNSEKGLRKIDEDYGPENIKELVSEIKQKVIEHRKYGLPESFFSLSHYILSKNIIDLQQSKSFSALVSEFDPSEIGECKQLFSFGGDGYYDAKDLLIIDFGSHRTLDIISQVKVRIATFKNLFMMQVPNKNANINKFLCKYFPREGDTFYFNYANPKIIKFEFYREALFQAISRVTERVLIECCILNQEEIIEVMAKAKKLNTFGFHNGELDLYWIPQFGSSLKGSKIKRFELRGNKSWKNILYIPKIIKGLAQSKDFLHNLKEINIFQSDISKQEVRLILKEYPGTENLKIISEADKPIIQN